MSKGLPWLLGTVSSAIPSLPLGASPLYLFSQIFLLIVILFHTCGRLYINVELCNLQKHFFWTFKEHDAQH